MVGGPSKVFAILCGLGPPGVKGDFMGATARDKGLIVGADWADS